LKNNSTSHHSLYIAAMSSALLSKSFVINSYTRFVSLSYSLTFLNSLGYCSFVFAPVMLWPRRILPARLLHAGCSVSADRRRSFLSGLPTLTLVTLYNITIYNLLTPGPSRRLPRSPGRAGASPSHHAPSPTQIRIKRYLRVPVKVHMQFYRPLPLCRPVKPWQAYR
jgi:hypothetical protein